MKIAGLQLNSFVDYNENIAAVIFIGGCNFNCDYCHNIDITGSDFEALDTQIVISKIEKRKTFLDGVVISGGEPTLQSLQELILLIQKIKEMGLLVKLDTNGTNAKKLKELIKYVDYVAMDIKAPLDKYNLVTKITQNQIDNIKESIEIVKNFNGEFRTTVIPELTIDDIKSIAKLIASRRVKYYLQKVNYTKTYNQKPLHAPDFFDKAKDAASVYIETVVRS